MSEPTTTSEYYRPIERPRRYPLELTDELEINLWHEGGKCKHMIARVDVCVDSIDLQIFGDRALDKRVNWRHFGELYEQAIRIAQRELREPEGGGDE